jgi:hypothetical protein
MSLDLLQRQQPANASGGGAGAKALHENKMSYS